VNTRSHALRRPARRWTPLAGAAAVALLVSACGGQDPADPASGTAGGGAGEIRVDGSSTVAPLTSAAAELFRAENPDINVSVGTSGTGGGFQKFCAGETDISNASRPISDEEKAACESAGIANTEVVVANDAITVVVNQENDWATCLTVEELKTIWAPESEGTITSWSQVRDGFPDVPLELYGAGTDSGTFDYFTDAINGEEGASRTDYNPSEDDNVTVQGVTGSEGALGYFGFSYYEENADQLRAVEIDGGNGCVAPSSQSAQVGSYTPLSRPLFVYVANQSYVERPEVQEFVDFYVANDEAITEQALFVPLNEQQRQAAADAVAGIS
jgi:phosphate transport system substrate-binding protein